MQKNIEVWLNNNPICETTLEQSVRQEVWNLKNIPHILVHGTGFEDGSSTIKICADDFLLKEDSIHIENNTFDYKLELSQPLKNCSKIEVLIDDFSQVSFINLKRLHGKVQHLNGENVKNPVILSPKNDMVVLGDDNGCFEVLLSSKEQLAVFDKGYSKDNLEVWLENVNLQEDTELSIKVGQAEIFGMEMWKQVASVYIHFIPMSLNRVNEIRKKGASSELEIITNKDSFARLNKEDISVYVDDEAVKILSFAEIEDFICEIDDKEIKRFGYVIAIPKLAKGKHRLLRLVVNCRFETTDGVICDTGEAYYFL